jgi:hypothetical protein
MSSRHLFGGTEENNENLSQDTRYPNQDSKQAAPYYMSEYYRDLVGMVEGISKTL